MALLEKIFYLKRKFDDKRESRDRGRSRQITSEHVRLLLFKDCDLRGRKLLFDSSTIEKVQAGKNDKPNAKQTGELPCVVEVSAGFSYVYKGPASDASVLGEMIFGAVAMNLKSVSLKIHIMDEPRRLMCTKVFCIPTSRRISKAERKTSDVTSSGNLRSQSKPLNVPLQKEEGVSLSFSIDRGDSGFCCAEQSPLSSVSSTYDYFSMFDIWDESNGQDDSFFHCPPGRRLSTSSNGSWQRRTFRNMATRFDLGSQSSNLLSVPTKTSNSSDSQLYTNSSASGTNDSLTSSLSALQRRNKLGLALLVTVADAAEMELVRRCVEHCPQLQALVSRLRLAALTAGAGASFVAVLHQAAADAAVWLSDLMHGPRVPPAWLGLLTARSQQAANKAADSLLADLCFVLNVGDTKCTNFFISTLLTHVLTYHLGWVTTVSPYDTLDPQTLSLDAMDPTRPYNALWAQLSDLCGSIGFPPRAAKTIISGTTNTQFIKRLLVVLTYFVRCGDVTRCEYDFKDIEVKENEIVNVGSKTGMKRNVTTVKKLVEMDTENLQVQVTNTQNSLSSVSCSTIVAGDVSLKKTTTLAAFGQMLSSDEKDAQESSSTILGQLRRNPTMLLPATGITGSSSNSSISDVELEQKVVFVLGEDEKLVGLKNKSNGKKVKKSSKVHMEPLELDVEKKEVSVKESTCDEEKCKRSLESPSKCCGQTLKHSTPIKHSGFKFEFDKYPQIVTNYMKSKNLKILDRHYIGQPGNLKVDDFQYDPTVVPPIQEERCEACYKCQLESMLQTPTNASEMEYMNDMPRQLETKYATESVVNENSIAEASPKTFTRKNVENTVVVNVTKCDNNNGTGLPKLRKREKKKDIKKEIKEAQVKRVLEFPLTPLCVKCQSDSGKSGFDTSLLGGVTDHYVPDLILQGTMAPPEKWEAELRRDLDLTSYLNKSLDAPIQTVAVVGDTNKWEVSVVGRSCGSGGMSALVAAMLEALPAMMHARVPAQQCLLFLESKLREFCVLSKTLADMLMSTDFCDIATLTKSLNIDVNDVPLLLAVATTHTPQVAKRYGISYR